MLKLTSLDFYKDDPHKYITGPLPLRKFLVLFRGQELYRNVTIISHCKCFLLLFIFCFIMPLPALPNQHCSPTWEFFGAVRSIYSKVGIHLASVLQGWYWWWETRPCEMTPKFLQQKQAKCLKYKHLQWETEIYEWPKNWNFRMSFWQFLKFTIPNSQKLLSIKDTIISDVKSLVNQSYAVDKLQKTLLPLKGFPLHSFSKL